MKTINSIIIRGYRESGKSTTIREVCRKLEPTKVCSLHLRKKQIAANEKSIEDIHNGTHILEVKGKTILVVAGAPTEQNVTITRIFEICSELNIPIDFIICAMRSKEIKKSFATVHEIKKISTLIDPFYTCKIDGDDFLKSDKWKEWISKIYKTINDNLF